MPYFSSSSIQQTCKSTIISSAVVLQQEYSIHDDVITYQDTAQQEKWWTDIFQFRPREKNIFIAYFLTEETVSAPRAIQSFPHLNTNSDCCPSLYLNTLGKAQWLAGAPWHLKRMPCYPHCLQLFYSCITEYHICCLCIILICFVILSSK